MISLALEFDLPTEANALRSVKGELLTTYTTVPSDVVLYWELKPGRAVDCSQHRKDASMKSFFAFAIALAISLSSPAWAQSSLSSGPDSPSNSGSNKASIDQSSPVEAPTPPGEGASAGASGTGPTAPQEKQDKRSSGELSPSEHNDPGTKTSPPANDK